MSASLYSNGQLANGTRRSWISTTAFNNDFFSYSTTVNPTTFQTTGSLAAVVGATAGNCPAGRVLRENGKKLYPDAHDGVETYMVGVFDPISFLSGFIDPNSPIFAVYNTDKPASLDTIYGAAGANANGGASDRAPPVYTSGTVTAVGDITSTTGDITATLGEIVAGGQIRSGTTVLAPQALSNNSNIAVDNVTYPTQNFTISVSNTPNAGITGVNFDFASGGTVGDIINIIVTNTEDYSIGLAVGTNSKIPTTGVTLTAGGASNATAVSVLTWISNGTNFYLSSVTTSMAA